MNRIIKKMTVVFLSLAITLLAFPAGILTAYAGAGKITFSDPTASVGNQVSVTMKIASSDGTALNKASAHTGSMWYASRMLRWPMCRRAEKTPRAAEEIRPDLEVQGTL